VLWEEREGKDETFRATALRGESFGLILLQLRKTRLCTRWYGEWSNLENAGKVEEGVW
jgi:hypothetical protein